MTNRTLIKITQIARMRISGMKDVRIAEILGLSTPGLARILATNEYKDYETSLLEGHITSMDEALAGRVKEMQGHFRTGVPAAIRALLDTVVQRKDLKSAMIAAREILDRDPDRAFVKDAAKNGQGLSANASQMEPAALANTVTEADKVVEGLAASMTASQKPGNA